MKITVINTGYFKLDGGAMFGVVPKSIWSKTNPPDSNNMCSWAMRSMLIEMDNQLILIDTGIGNKQSDKFFSYYFLHGEESLEKSNFLIKGVVGRPNELKSSSIGSIYQISIFAPSRGVVRVLVEKLTDEPREEPSTLSLQLMKS